MDYLLPKFTMRSPW